MTLRSRLTLAFFAISVVPLAAVTLFSYASSERALRRVAEQQADELAVELGRRMEFVTADLERRMERAWPPPSSPSDHGAAHGRTDRRAAQPAAPPEQQASSEQMAGHVAGVLGDLAPMLDAVEVVAPPRRPAMCPATGRRSRRAPGGHRSGDRLPAPTVPPASRRERRRSCRRPSKRS